ncbi:two-component system histidine kinase PnpS [Geosporobacter ferrireducens]|uniref:Phosphate regulon sensor protein PhoR n=1 Tax=Geosporobacter ferrireducens TaxID=1424294 RepID=A0A1D8GC17_9FIRM|nr:phosphate regulon sensor histidine kinase PhoR [Geosporobacter ferrireducens]AOT68448.1 phosphate regulon sensor histidine kinase PhoR [Geosporobacter ferrireducens]MTI53906.1 phosphate regulon sensor histidine kinase PhoR [Geosporobacter ferrireducens]
MQRKIFLTYTLLFLVGIIITGLLSLGFMQKSYMENTEDKLVAYGNLINGFLRQRTYEDKLQQLDYSRLAYEYSQEINARVTFINLTGQVIGDSEVKPENIQKIENHLYRPEIQEALSGKVGKSKRTSSTTDVNYIYVAVPLMLDGQIYTITRLAFPLTEINRINFMLMQNVLIAAFCGMIVATILGYRYVNSVTKPIKEITRTAQNIANGALNNRVYVNTSDEIKILADTFNIMTEKLNETISELWDKNTKLQSTLASMNEALFAIDKSYKIMLMNPVAKALFRIENEQVMGKHILEVIRNNKLHDVLQDILNSNHIGQREITIDYPEPKILKIYTNFIRLDMDPNRIIGVMALIQDVTEMRKLEKMRSDFVANVSHELKTPLTSITGFIETLKNGAIDNEKVRNRFLDIIEIETERLSRLIDDLLSLSAIEHDRLSFTKEKIKVNEAIKEIREMVDGLAKQKKIKISFELDGSLPEIYGNPDWFKQMMINLVDNAIKYTQEGGGVKVLAYKRYENIIITVKDTGIGIPKEDIPRLFERFYRVDKARSKKAGGTGLGLAIVKHIVLSFDGEIKVNSELGKGSEFIVRIPLS